MHSFDDPPTVRDPVGGTKTLCHPVSPETEMSSVVAVFVSIFSRRFLFGFSSMRMMLDVFFVTPPILAFVFRIVHGSLLLGSGGGKVRPLRVRHDIGAAGTSPAQLSRADR